MDCVRVNECLWEYLAGELDEALQKDVEAHLSSCSSCSYELDSIREIKSSFKSVPHGLDLESAEKRVLHRLFSSHDSNVTKLAPRRNKKVFRWIMPAGAVAATFLAMFIGMWPAKTSALSLDDFLGRHMMCVKEGHHEGYACNTQMDFSVKAVKELGFDPVPFKTAESGFVKGDICKVGPVMTAHALFDRGGGLLSHFSVKGESGNFVRREGVKKVRDGMWELSLRGYNLIVFEADGGRYEVYIAKAPFEEILNFVEESSKEAQETGGSANATPLTAYYGFS